MEWIFFLLVVTAVYYYIRSNRRAVKTQESPPLNPSQKRKNESRCDPIEDNGNMLPKWLIDRWQDANQALLGDDHSEFQKWYFEPPSQAQMTKIESQGWKLKARPTKGQASDLIGIGEQPDHDEIELLRFFKQYRKGLSQTEAREIVRKIFSSEDNRTAWQRRPPQLDKKLFFQFFGEQMPKGLIHEQADKVIQEIITGRPGIEHTWDTIRDIWDELSDSDTRTDYGLKKFTLNQFVAAAKAAQVGGEELTIDTVSEKMAELYPQLEAG